MLHVRPIAFACACLLSLALLLGACGDSGDEAGTTTGATAGPSANEYAVSVCGAVDAWLLDLQEAYDGLPQEKPAPKEAQALLVSLHEQIADAAGTMVSSVEAAGTPNVTDGAAAQEHIVETLTTLQEEYAAAATTLSKADTSDEKAFAETMQSVGADVQAASTEAVAGLQSIPSEALQQAFIETPECEGLGGTGASGSPAPAP